MTQRKLVLCWLLAFPTACNCFTVQAQETPLRAMLQPPARSGPIHPSAPRQMDIPAIAKAANGAVVSIIISGKDGRPIAQGSGFLISKDGRIVTNYHVIKGGTSAIAKLPNGAFFVVDGVLAVDKSRDIAILKAHGTDFRTVTLGNSANVQVGEEIVAIGNPLSLESTVSDGIVSAVRIIGGKGRKLLQITAPISPGSSGGPLFNMTGKVVGITTSSVKDGENLNFAIPINAVKLLIPGDSAKLTGFTGKARSEKQAVVSTKRPSNVPSDWQRCPDKGGGYFYASVCPTTARVMAIKRAMITTLGLTVPDFATCMKPYQNMSLAEQVRLGVGPTCYQISHSAPPGYYPPETVPGYLVTLETLNAVYVVSTQGVCTQVLEDGKCGGDWAPDVVVGQTYEFDPPAPGERLISLEEQSTRTVKLIGSLESVVEKKRLR